MYAFHKTGGQFDGLLAQVVVNQSGGEMPTERKEEKGKLTCLPLSEARWPVFM